MPNWCENRLEISGRKPSVQKFLKENKTRRSALSFQKAAPCPKPILKTERKFPVPQTKETQLLKKKYGAQDWYEWNCKNWGTKWDASDAQLLGNYGDFAEIEFQSAWSPPVEWLERAAKKYPHLRFYLEYHERGMGFLGVAVAFNGRLIQDESISIR